MAGRATSRGRVVEHLQLPEVNDTTTQAALKRLLDSVRDLQERQQPVVLSGKGTPEGSVSALVGALYTRTDGGAGTTLYVKESGTGNTGWVAK